MRVALVLLAFATLVGSFFYWLIVQYPGFVLISVGTTAVQFTLWTGILALLVIWFLLRALVRLLRALVLPGVHLRSNWQTKKQKKNDLLTYRGLVDLAEGRWDSACHQLTKSAADSDLSLINYLGAASAASELGKDQEVNRLLDLAEKADSHNGVAVGLTRARLLIRNDNYAEALAILQSLHGRQPTHPYVLSLLSQAYRKLKQWDQLEKLLADLRSSKVMDASDLERLEILLRREQLRCLAENLGSDSAKNKQNLADLWGRTAKVVRSAPAVIASHALVLSRLGEIALAEKELRRAIKKTWDKDLLRAYGQLEGDSSQQLKVAEVWIKEQPQNPDLLLTLARLCKRGELWGKARDYLEAALKLEHRSEIYAELAEVLGYFGELEKSRQFYRQGLLEITDNNE